MARFVDAARDGDCAVAFRLMSSDSDVVDGTGGTREGFCESIRQSASDPRSFFSRVKKDDASRQPGRLRVTTEHERDAVYDWYLATE